MKRMKLTTAGRVVIFVIVLALLAGIGGFGYNYYKNNKMCIRDRHGTKENSEI